MKNLFKNLMLVAVAAMAFTACTETNDEVNAVVNKTRYEFTANIAEETRSGFTGSEVTEDENGKKVTVYKSEWFGNETLKIFVTDFSTYNVETTAEINAEGQFDLELENAPESFFMTVVSPAESWASEYTATIPTEQTPLANSVDPKAHLLQAQAVPVSGGQATINLNHMAAYGKMTVKGVDFAIHHVVVDLKGTFYGNDRELSYTINATNVENNTFWFATEPIDVAEFTVTAYGAEDKAVTKTVDVAEAGKTMSFQYGRVGTFSVSGLEAVVAPEEPKALVFTGASVTGNYGDVYAYFYSADGDVLKLNPYYVFEDGVWPVGTHVITAATGYVYPGLGQGYSAFNGVDVDGGEIVVSVKNKMYYIEFNNIVDASGNILIQKAVFEGEIEGLDIPDSRTKLATPSNITASADGKTITLSWDAVEGADGYRVKLFSPYDEYFEKIVATNEYVYEAQLYSTQYSFTIMSYASNENETYKSSDDAYAYVTTGKDPNKFADVVANKIIWDSSISAFKMTGEVVSGTAWGHSGDYIRLYINESDRPGNNSIKVGTYTGCGSTSPQAGQFGARLSLYWGTVTYPSNFGSQSTVEVSYDEAVGYTIVLTHNNVTYGYKGMPDGWVAPAEGGESGGNETENPGDGGSNELGSETNPYTFTSVASNNFFLNFEGAENGASLQLDRQNSDVNVMSNYGGPFALNYTAIIYAGSGNIYNVNGAIYQYAQFAPYSTLEVTKANGNWTCKLKMSVDQGATYTYYTFTGQIANQAY